MANLFKAIFLEVIFREWCADKGLPHSNKAVRAAYASAILRYRFTFTVEA